MNKPKLFKHFALVIFVLAIATFSIQTISKVWLGYFVFKHQNPISINIILIASLMLCLFLLVFLNFKNRAFTSITTVLILSTIPLLIFISVFPYSSLITASRYGGSGDLLSTMSNNNYRTSDLIPNYGQILRQRNMEVGGIKFDLRNHSQTTHPPGQLILMNSVLNNPLNVNWLSDKQLTQQDHSFMTMTIWVILFAVWSFGLLYLCAVNLTDHITALILSTMGLGIVAMYGYISYFDTVNVLLTLLGTLLLINNRSRLGHVMSGSIQAINASIAFNVLPIIIVLPLLINIYKPTNKLRINFITYLAPIVVMIIFYNYFGFNYITGFFQSIYNIRQDFNVTVPSYTLGLQRNSSLMVTQFGLLNFALIILAFVAGIYYVSKETKIRKEYLPILFTFGYLVITTLSGQSRGEMARTMMFVYPLLILFSYPLMRDLLKISDWRIVFSSVYISELFFVIYFLNNFTMSHILIQ